MKLRMKIIKYGEVFLGVNPPLKSLSIFFVKFFRSVGKLKNFILYSDISHLYL